MKYIFVSNVLMVLKLYRINANLIIHFRSFWNQVHQNREKCRKMKY